MAKTVAVLCDDPKASIPLIDAYPNCHSLPTPSAIDFTSGQLLGSLSRELGLRRFLEDAGHILEVTSDKEGKEGKDSVFERELIDADVVNRIRPPKQDLQRA